MHRHLAVRLRVAAALHLDYCFAGPRDAAVGATLLLPLLFWLGLLRIPLVRWSLGFVPELVFGLGFGSGGGFFWLGLLRIPLVCWSLGFVPELVFGLGFGSGGGSFVVGRHTSFRCSATEAGWCCQVLEYLVDVSRNIQKKRSVFSYIIRYIYIYIYI